MLLTFMGCCKQNFIRRLLIYLPAQLSTSGAAAPLSWVVVFSGCATPAEPPPAAGSSFCCSVFCATRNLAARIWPLVTSYTTPAFIGTFVLWHHARAFLCSFTNLRNTSHK